MLVDRRRQLGLTVAQASRVLKLKEQVLISFEEGDFDNIPKSGYAQGMLSSYARYLGLNPREVTDQFTEDLFEYSNGSFSHELRRRTRESRSVTDEPVYELPNTTSSQVRRPQDHQLTSNGVRSGDGRGTTSGSLTGSSYVPRGDTASSYRSRGVEPTSLVNTRGGAGAPTGAAAGRGGLNQGYPQGRPYTSRTPNDRQRMTQESQYASRSRQGRGTSDGRQRPVSATGRGRADDARQGRGGSYSRGDITTRSVRPDEYTDDLRYGSATQSYEAASTQSGRRSSRNIANSERPNVRRRSSSSDERQMRDRGRRQPPRRGGVAGALEEYFSDSRRAIITILFALVVILVLVISLSVRSCTASKTTSGKQVSVSSTSAESVVTATTSSADQQAAEQQALSDAAAASAAASEAAATQETDVTVSVASGQVSWVEIESDGDSKVAETITGPWEQTYVVTQSITIQVGDTTAVTVTKNGTQVQFEQKTSGIGQVTIAGTAVPTTDASTAAASSTSAG